MVELFPPGFIERLQKQRDALKLRLGAARGALGVGRRRMVRVAETSLPWLGVRALGFGDGYVRPHSVMACKDEGCSVCASLPGVRYRGRR